MNTFPGYCKTVVNTKLLYFLPNFCLQTIPVIPWKYIHPHCSSSRPTWPNSSLSLSQGRNMFFFKKHCLLLQSVSIPHPNPTDTFEVPWHREGMFGGPHPNAWGPGDGLFKQSFITLVWFGSPPDSNQRNEIEDNVSDCLLCLATGKRSLDLQGHTSQSLLGFPWLYERGQTDWRPQSF